MKTKQTKDHYVSQTYLRRFLTPGTGTLFVYNKNKDGSFKVGPASICAEKGWDNLDDDGKIPPMLKEELQALEPNLDKCLNILIRHPLHDLDRFALSMWLAILQCLNPNNLLNFENFVKEMGNLTLEMLMSKPSEYMSEKDIQFYNKHKDKMELTVNKYYPKNLAMSNVYLIALSIYVSDWIITENKTELKYLTCDKPFHFICWHDNPNNTFNPKGIAIDPEHYLMIAPLAQEKHQQIKNNKDKDYTYFDAGQTRYAYFDSLTKHNMRAIKFINQHTIYNADRFILSQNSNKNLDSFIRHNKQFCTRTRVDRIDIGGGQHLIMTRLENTFPNFEPNKKFKKKI